MIAKSSFAKVDPAFFVDGLFTPRANTKIGIDVKREFAGGRIRFLGRQLGAVHQSVLLALCALTARNGQIDKSNDKKNKLTTNASIIKSITDDVQLVATSFSRVDVSMYSLLADAGMQDNGNDYKRLIDILTELANITVYRSVGKRGGISQLLSFEHDASSLSISLNWRLADAIFAHQNVQVSLHERRALTSPTAKLLHAWLSAHVRLGQSLMNGQGASADALCRHVWGADHEKADRRTASKRRGQIKVALNEIGELDGWIMIDAKTKYLITRPKQLPILSATTTDT